MVAREIQVQIGRQKRLGLIASIQPDLRSKAEISMADGSTFQLDLMRCEFKRFNADQPKVVAWELTRPETWLLDNWPAVINDSSCDFDHSAKSKAARLEWARTGGKLFPTTKEAIAVLQAARDTVDDGASCQLIDAVLQWEEATPLPQVIHHLERLLNAYQTGSMLNDCVQVLLTRCQDELWVK